MCGLCGKLILDETAGPVRRESLHGMMAMLQHRGPDEEGMYLADNVGLGHRRLRIIDLTSGAQPMANEDNTIWVVYNGEVYNYKELRSYLSSKGHLLRTTSDTEVIAHLYEEFGEGCVEKLQGMFSFALWDEKNSVLLLARDRVGIKPLYYSLTNDALLFASEIKSILSDPGVSRDINLAAIDRFLTLTYLAGNQTLFKHVHKLSPGHYLTVRKGLVKITRYWDLQFSGAREHQPLEESIRELSELLGQTVRDHMISDVPVGVLLSGGVDSTAVLSYAAEYADSTLSTFTVGFDEHKELDERLGARSMAKRYGTWHCEATVTAQDFADCLPKYVWHMEEPVCEPPAIALYYITKLARERVTVLLSGEGGDEAFAGYTNYRNIVWLERVKAILGSAARPLGQVGARMANVAGWRRAGRYCSLMTLPLEQYYRSRTSDPLAFFNQNRETLYTQPFLAELQSIGHDAGSTDDPFACAAQTDTLQRLLYIDTKTWLPDDLLVKADKMTMANSVELRVPFLDHRVLEFAASLPAKHKLHGFRTKYVLKRALSTRIPPEVLRRPKTGFPIPYATWLRGELRGLARDILTDPQSAARGYFDRGAIDRLLEENATDGRFAKTVFSLMVLELWHRSFLQARNAVVR